MARARAEGFSKSPHPSVGLVVWETGHGCRRWYCRTNYDFALVQLWAGDVCRTSGILCRFCAGVVSRWRTEACAV